ncbi:hypothetical protein J437_LFUL001221 [Ladona fulva]|uniref:Uncharacterized protein n=1 Tax=Ladona fulva TaxID=123851 RepID=A0A8K0JVV3_LADFU|nr:hypothetical protein J437_LFUL001221 [Ladona fulva]
MIVAKGENKSSPMRYMCRSASRARRPSPYKLMAARGLWALRSVEQQLGVVRFLRTLALFISAAVCFAPTLAVVHVGKFRWILMTIKVLYADFTTYAINVFVLF